GRGQMSSDDFGFALMWHTAGWTMLQFLWIGGLAALAAALLNRAFHRRSPAARYALVLVQFVILALIPWCLFAWKLNYPAATPNKGRIGPGGSFGDSLFLAEDDRESDAFIRVPEQESPALADSDGGLSRAANERSVPQTDPAAAPGESAARVPPGAQAPAPPRPLTMYLPKDTGRIADFLPWIWIVGFPLACLYLLTGIAGAERFRRRCRIVDD